MWVDEEGEEHQVLVTCPSCQTHIDLNNEPVPDQDVNPITLEEISETYLPRLEGEDVDRLRGAMKTLRDLAEKVLEEDLSDVED